MTILSTLDPLLLLAPALLWALLQPLIFILIGQSAYQLLAQSLGWQGKQAMQAGTWLGLIPSENKFPRLSVLLALGLLIYLLSFFLLASLGLRLPLASLLPAFLALPARKHLGDLFRTDHAKPGLNLVLWFAVVLGIGASLLRALNGIETPWKNNYGDVTYHLGMITSFVFGDNIPPEYHLFPGVRLSYPFFVNLWAASVWWILPDFKFLCLIFTLHWTIVWCAVYFLLNGNATRLLPWALLLGGGSYAVIGQNSGELIAQGAPWTLFLTTIWVPQRTAMLGVLVLLAGLRLFFHSQERELEVSTSLRVLLLSALVLSLGVLAHTHFFLTGAAFAGLALLAGFICKALPLLRKLNKSNSKLGAEVLQALKPLLYFAAGLLPALFSLPWVLGKAQGSGPMWQITYGWSSPPLNNVAFWEGVRTSAHMWRECAGAWLALMLFIWLLTWQHRYFIAIWLLFLGANFVQLAFWEWDQIKIFLGLYAIFLCLWATSDARSGSIFTPTCRRLLAVSQLLCLPLIVPSLAELTALFKKGEMFGVYSAEEVAWAKSIRESVPPSAVLQGRPDHNTLITLTGRRIFSGYDGTLHSHGLDYAQRVKLIKDLDSFERCSQMFSALEQPATAAACPEYIIWTQREREYWDRPVPGQDFEEIPMQSSEGKDAAPVRGVLYRLKKQVAN